LGVKYAYLSVFNRWGEKVFETENAIINGWDGTYKGVLAPSGVYYFKAELFYLNGEIKTQKGDITLIR
jgi:gliding motility-associated-like protein